MPKASKSSWLFRLIPLGLLVLLFIGFDEQLVGPYILIGILLYALYLSWDFIRIRPGQVTRVEVLLEATVKGTGAQIRPSQVSAWCNRHYKLLNLKKALGTGVLSFKDGNAQYLVEIKNIDFYDSSNNKLSSVDPRNVDPYDLGLKLQKLKYKPLTWTCIQISQV